LLSCKSVGLNKLALERPLRQALLWIEPHQALPDPKGAWLDPNGLLCAGQDLSTGRLLEAYAKGIFPWYSPGQPVLWWSPDPRMVLSLEEFKLHRSLRKTLTRVKYEGQWSLSLNRCFSQVMRACAAPRDGQSGSWITEEIIAAYTGLHESGLAHSIEVWEKPEPQSDSQAPQLIAGLYGVALGKMFFGESMFTLRTDASKLAFLCLVKNLMKMGFTMLDCQQNTRHLASFGAREIPRPEFLERIRDLMDQSEAPWQKLCDAEGRLVWPDI
jgi:leucyl/phenylalanyl-tRNA---protein transferase